MSDHLVPEIVVYFEVTNDILKRAAAFRNGENNLEELTGPRINGEAPSKKCFASLVSLDLKRCAELRKLSSRVSQNYQICHMAKVA